MILEFDRRATKELQDAYRWYEGRNARAAAKFALAVDFAIDLIQRTPNRFVSVGRGCRACALRHFPYRVVYRGDASRIRIIAIAHLNRRPGFWKRRVSDGN